MLDIIIFQKINNLVHISSFLDYIGIFLADYLEYFLIILALFFLFLPKAKFVRKRLIIISAFISAIISRFFITEIIRFFYHRPRPYIVLESAQKIISENKDFSSFPSGHAAFFFALAMGIYFYNKKLGILFFIATILMGIARIFVGVHWPTDILGGAIIGIIFSVIINKIMKIARTKTRVVPTSVGTH